MQMPYRTAIPTRRLTDLPHLIRCNTVLRHDLLGHGRADVDVADVDPLHGPPIMTEGLRRATEKEVCFPSAKERPPEGRQFGGTHPHPSPYAAPTIVDRATHVRQRAANHGQFRCFSARSREHQDPAKALVSLAFTEV